MSELGLPPPPEILLPPSYSLNLISTDTSDGTYLPTDCKPVPLIGNKLLTPKDYDRDIRHYTLDIEGLDMDYETGDVLAIYPRNDKEKVAMWLDHVGINGDQCFEIAS